MLLPLVIVVVILLLVILSSLLFVCPSRLYHGGFSFLLWSSAAHEAYTQSWRVWYTAMLNVNCLMERKWEYIRGEGGAVRVFDMCTHPWRILEGVGVGKVEALYQSHATTGRCRFVS